MALIPITFKADSETNAKKGKIRAEDYSALSAFSLKKKTGILDLSRKCEAYNVTTIGGTAQFYLHGGYVVICGRWMQVEEATSVSVPLPASGSVTGYFGIKIDLSAAQDNECLFFSKTGELIQNDLNENPVSGIYEFPLFSYRATPSAFEITAVSDQLIKKNDQEVSAAAVFTSSRDGEIDDEKTIGEKFDEINARLTTLGFKSGDSEIVTGKPHITITEKMVRRAGNFVYGKIVGYATLGTSYTAINIVDLPSDFRPRVAQSGVYGLADANDQNAISRTVTFNTDGSVVFSPMLSGISGNRYFSILFGFEGAEI